VSGQAGSDEPRQRIVRSRHGRRAQLTPAPGTTAEPRSPEPRSPESDDAGDGAPAASGPNDDRMRRDVPPHY